MQRCDRGHVLNRLSTVVRWMEVRSPQGVQDGCGVRTAQWLSNISTRYWNEGLTLQFSVRQAFVSNPAG